MHYISTRGGGDPRSFSEILISGLAEDGGLMVPSAYPKISISDLKSMRSLSYADLATEILRLFAPEISKKDLRSVVRQTYRSLDVFSSPEITPLRCLDNNTKGALNGSGGSGGSRGGLFLLDLSTGPTLAFKDVALQLLGNLFQRELSLRDEKANTSKGNNSTDGAASTCDASKSQTLNVLGATSGDTGSSAESALKGKRSVRVFFLSPLGRISPFQAAQMFSVQETNVFNIAVRDSCFDECQGIVKEIMQDADFKRTYNITAVNSINWARIAAQTVYYFKAYFALPVVQAFDFYSREAETVSGWPQVSFSVPTGNFGNILAGHIARQMGLPIRRLILASNENGVLDEFFRTGVYRTRAGAEVVPTSSPSMDICRSSNIERFIFDLLDRDASRLASLWGKLEKDGYFDLKHTKEFVELQETFGIVSGQSTHADRLETIRAVHAHSGATVDPQTADGIAVGQRLREKGVPLICMETAKPAKFFETIKEALGPEAASSCDRGHAADVESRPQRYTVLDADVQAVRNYIAQHCGGGD